MFNQVLSKVTWPLRKIDQRIEQEIADKTDVAIRTVAQRLDELAPPLAALLAGEEVELSIRLKRKQ